VVCRACDKKGKQFLVREKQKFIWYFEEDVIYIIQPEPHGSDSPSIWTERRHWVQLFILSSINTDKDLCVTVKIGPRESKPIVAQRVLCRRHIPGKSLHLRR
jgi:hypothetical protein